MRLFVYGTLKRGFSSHFYFQKLAKPTFLGEATTCAKYIMLHNQAFPLLITKVQSHYPYPSHRVKGELYQVEDLGALDEYEGVPKFYVRKIIPVRMHLTAEIVPAHVYFWAKPTDYQHRLAPVEDLKYVWNFNLT